MKDELFAELVDSVREGREILCGETQASRAFTIHPPNIKNMRNGFSLTQDRFTAMFGISVRTLHNWEQGRRVPEGPARVLLQVAGRHPEAVLDVVYSKDS